YSAYQPIWDRGVIAPTAALSSMPYAPEQSMRALRYFMGLGERVWRRYGFIDAFNETEGWYGDDYLAIDQGAIIAMIENHRSGLLWRLFMSCPEVGAGLARLGFEGWQGA
ncbi:MAG: glucoamylase family protein, partial [Alphaproteobacteria bacterium]